MRAQRRQARQPTLEGRLLKALVGLAAVMAVVAVLTAPDKEPRDPIEGFESIAASAPGPDPGLAPSPVDASTLGASPGSIVIPDIGVNAPLVGVQLNPDGTLPAPARFSDAGWYAGSSRPGDAGPAIVAGHVDSKKGPAVFYRLRELAPGNLVHVVRDDGATVTYAVDGVEQYPQARFPSSRVYGPTDGPTLRLITCGGAFNKATGHYVDNVVAYATIVA